MKMQATINTNIRPKKVLVDFTRTTEHTTADEKEGSKAIICEKP